MNQIVMELQDKVETGQIKFTWMPNEDPVTVTSIDVLSDDYNNNEESSTTISNVPAAAEHSRSTSPILIAVPLVIVCFILLVILVYFFRRRYKRKSKAGQQYSLILNRNRSDTSCAEDDDYLTVEDYDIHDGDSNIVINHDFQSSLEFMNLGTTRSNDTVNC